MSIAIILAAGNGKRMGEKKKKQFIRLNGKYVFWWSLEQFVESKLFDKIIVVFPPNELDKFRQIIETFAKEKNVSCSCIAGGFSRAESVFNALKYCKKSYNCNNDGNILIHDSARPLIQIEDIKAVLKELQTEASVTLGYKVKDTIKRIEKETNCIKEDLKREELCGITTPQGFKFGIIYEAHSRIEDKSGITDDTELVSRLGIKSKIIISENVNFKITTPSDLQIIEAIILQRC